MTSEQVKNVEGVEIENQFGVIRFLEPVSLFKKRVEECVDIGQDAIEFSDEGWETKRCEMTFKNFGNYKALGGEEREKMERKMKKWA